jgi:hypothetical protein
MTNKMHYIDIDINNFKDIELDSKYYEEFLNNIIKKYPKIDLKYGDFVENGFESGYRTNGVYMINKNKKNELSIVCLENHMDDYGTIPENFISFVNFDPGYHFEMEMPSDCKSYMHNNYIPLSLNFLRDQIWIKKGSIKECFITYNNKKIILIRQNRKYLRKLNNKIIYGQIYMKNQNNFDSCELSSVNHLKDENIDIKKYDDCDKIILI